MAVRAAEALEALTEAYRQRDSMTPLIGTEPSFTALHAEPPLAELPGKMGSVCELWTVTIIAAFTMFLNQPLFSMM
jgi:hypothetical protein